MFLDDLYFLQGFIDALGICFRDLNETLPEMVL